jgi:hypothetical protein
MYEECLFSGLSLTRIDQKDSSQIKLIPCHTSTEEVDSADHMWQGLLKGFLQQATNN